MQKSESDARVIRVVCLILAGLGACLFMFSPADVKKSFECKLSKNRCIFKGFNITQNILKISDIEKAIVLKSVDTDGLHVFDLALVLKSKKNLPKKNLTLWTTGIGKYADYAKMHTRSKKEARAFNTYLLGKVDKFSNTWTYPPATRSFGFLFLTVGVFVLVISETVNIIKRVAMT